MPSPDTTTIQLHAALDELDRLINRGMPPNGRADDDFGAYQTCIAAVRGAYHRALATGQMLEASGKAAQPATVYATLEARHEYALWANWAFDHEPGASDLITRFLDTQPVFDTERHACCPRHPTRRLKAKSNGRGWRCFARDGEAWCGWEWAGAGYAPPKAEPIAAAASTEYVVGSAAYPVPTSAAALGQKEILPTRYFLDGMLRAGLALFIGNPGVGKTPALIQLGLSFATGGRWLGAIPCPHCRVLYIGVEYDEAYIKEVLIDSHGSTDLPHDFQILSIETFTPPATEAESMTMLQHYLDTLGAEVVIIDTFSGFLPREKFKQDKYRGDYAEFLAYQRLFLGARTLLVGAWHGGKYNKDPETAYNGGQGMWGSAGGGRLTMMHDESGQQVRLRSQLRGHERREWLLQQAHVGDAHFWSVIDADPDPIFGSDAQRRIYLAVKTHSTPTEPLTPAGVRAVLNADAPELGLKDPYIRQTLVRLTERGIFRNVNGGYVIQQRQHKPEEKDIF